MSQQSKMAPRKELDETAASHQPLVDDAPAATRERPDTNDKPPPTQSKKVE